MNGKYNEKIRTNNKPKNKKHPTDDNIYKVAYINLHKRKTTKQ